MGCLKIDSPMIRIKKRIAQINQENRCKEEKSNQNLEDRYYTIFRNTKAFGNSGSNGYPRLIRRYVHAHESTCQRTTKTCLQFRFNETNYYHFFSQIPTNTDLIVL